MEKSYGLFVEGTGVMLTSGLSDKNTSSLQQSITCYIELGNVGPWELGNTGAFVMCLLRAIEILGT